MHCATCFTDLQVRKSAMMFEHIYGVASFIVMLVALFCVFKMYLALTATCREHRAFLLESATREEQERVNRGDRENLKRIEGAMQKKEDQDGWRVDVFQCNMMNDNIPEYTIH